jgi:hypothetical protein
MTAKKIVLILMVLLIVPAIAGCNNNEEQTDKNAPVKVNNETGDRQNVSIVIKDGAGAIIFNQTKAFSPNSLSDPVTHVNTPGHYQFLVKTDSQKYDNPQSYDTPIDWIKLNIKVDRITLSFKKA